MNTALFFRYNRMIKIGDMGPRLSAIAGLVRQGVTLYDVGTDHGYLPLALITAGKIPFAVASDISKGPLASAENSFKTNGISNRVQTVLTSGLDGIELTLPCDVVIAGMGGETICEIIAAKPELKCGDVRLILQPMTKADRLRRFLSEQGFEAECELTVLDGKPYTVIKAFYSGIKYTLTKLELQIGKAGVRRQDSAFHELAKARRSSLLTVMDGKRAAGIDTANEEELIAELDELLNR